MIRKHIKVDKLIWDTWNKEHIKRHKVSVGEVEKGVKNGRKIIMDTYNNRFLVLVELKTRYISLIISKEKNRDYYVVTARPMSKKEHGIFKNEYP